MKIAYVAGPYRADSWEQKLSNIAAASDVARTLWAAGFAVVCPHKNSGGFDLVAPDDHFLQAYLEILEGCDFVVLTSNWGASEGTAQEVARARARGIPVYESAAAAVVAERRERSVDAY